MTNTRNTIRLRRVTEIVIRYRLAILLAAVAATALAVGPASRLDFDQSIESLYAVDDPDFLAYQESKAMFGGDEFVIVAYTDPDLFSPERLRHLRDFAHELSQVPGVEEGETQNLADALMPRKLNFFLKSLLRTPERKKKLRELSRALLLGDDEQTTAVILRLLPLGSTETPRAETIHRIREIADAHDLPAFVVGEPVQVHDMFRHVGEDGRKLFRISLVVLAATIFVLFRSTRWMILPLLVVGTAIIWTQALLVLSGMRLSMVSSMLNSLVTIIGIATVTHVTVHYRDLRADCDRIESLRRTVTDLAPAIFWTCATTAVGFAALLSSQIIPVQSFAIMMALGTLMVLAASATVLPGCILLGRFSPDPRAAPAEGRLVELLNRTTRWVERRPTAVTVTVVVVVLLVGGGFFRLEVETDFSKNFRESSPIRKALAFVENRLGGTGTWEIDFPASLDDVDRVRNLSQRLRDTAASENWQLTKVVSLTDGLDLIPGSVISQSGAEEKLQKLATFQPSFEPSLYSRRENRMRIVLRAREQERSDSKRQLIEAVGRIACDEFPAAHTTGLFVLFTGLIESLLRDQYVSLGLATVGICSMMALAFRSIRIGFVSLIPNLFPIVLVVGMMGWIGLPLNIATAMIASVSIGLTVDSSIHYISGYRRARQSGLAVLDALHVTHISVGRALVFANLALVLGFSVLTLSHFIPMIYFGILVSVAMLGGLTGNLVLLPLLLLWVEGREETFGTGSEGST